MLKYWLNKRNLQRQMLQLFHSQAIFRTRTLAISQCHASTLVEALDGSLLAAWFGGTYEGHPDVAIWLAHCRSGHWDRPIQVADVPDVPLWNPVLFRDLTGVLWLFYEVGPTVPTWTGAYMRSADNGHSWSGPTYLPAGLIGPSKNKPITLSNGDILCGTSAETWRSWACWAEISSDGGDSWQRYGPITSAGESGIAQQPISATWGSVTGRLILPDDHAGVIQPAVWEYTPGRLKMLMRATRRVGHICQAVSDDFGRTWASAQPTDLPNPNSGLDAVRLTDGRVALVYNPTQSARRNGKGLVEQIHLDLFIGDLHDCRLDLLSHLADRPAETIRWRGGYGRRGRRGRGRRNVG